MNKTDKILEIQKDLIDIEHRLSECGLRAAASSVSRVILETDDVLAILWDGAD